MPFSAMLDGHRVDLIGNDADEVWTRAQAAKRHGRLRCKGCDGALSLRDPIDRSRHFFHLRRVEHCPLGGPESEAHLRAKEAIADAARQSGGMAEIEWVGQGRTFVADVLAEWPDQSGAVLRVVFEIQVSSQTRDRTFERDAVREAAAHMTVWVLLAGPSEGSDELITAGWAHWSNEVASILLASDGDRAGWWADQIDGIDPCWRATPLTGLVGAIGRGAVFVKADHPWQHGGWISSDLWQRRQHQIEQRRQREEADRRTRERHDQNREAFRARAQHDVEALVARLTQRAHSPNVQTGGPMYGHAVLVTAGDLKYAVMPAANQIWSQACRSNLASTTVIASNEQDRHRLATIRITALTVSELTIPPPSSTTETESTSAKSDHGATKPTDSPPKRSGEQGPQPAAPTRRERRLQRATADEERGRATLARRAAARLKRREVHVRDTAERLGYQVGLIGIEEDWVVAEVAGRTVLTGPSSSSPPEAGKVNSVVWSSTPDQAARLAAEGWTTITNLSELQTLTC